MFLIKRDDIHKFNSFLKLIFFLSFISQSTIFSFVSLRPQPEMMDFTELSQKLNLKSN
jgi:hypothetical protein